MTLMEVGYIAIVKGGLVKGCYYGKMRAPSRRSAMECNYEDVKSKLEVVRISE